MFDLINPGDQRGNEILHCITISCKRNIEWSRDWRLPSSKGKTYISPCMFINACLHMSES